MTLIKVADWGPSDAKREYRDFWKEMLPKVAIVVERSFIQNGMRHPTRAAIVERVDVCKAIVNELRYDLKWSKQRIIDHLPVILRCRLSGIALNLEAIGRRATW